MNNLFRTPVELPEARWQLSYNDRILTVGSCFSDNIARKMQEYFLPVTANPFGTLYNPVSIRHHLDINECDKYNVIIVTFGTAWVYCDKNLLTDEEYKRADLCLSKEYSIYKFRMPLFCSVVDNCLKRPAADFYRYRLTVDDILCLYKPLLEAASQSRFVFTVSPIRHIKDGLHENQISKGILLQAVDCLCQTYQNADYFPSYEILLDELRDYRFYSADMFHPSDVAIDYIWQLFSQTYLADNEVKKSMDELHKLHLMLSHRPLHPQSEEYRQFKLSLMQTLQDMQNKYPNLKSLSELQL